MRLSAKILKNVIDVNHFQWSGPAHIQQGSANDVYFQLVNLDWSVSENIYQPAFIAQSATTIQTPNRYMSQAAALAVSASFDSIDDDASFTVAATQPFADDKSIWKLALTDSQIPGGGNFVITVTEDGVSKSFLVKQGITVQTLEPGGC